MTTTFHAATWATDIAADLATAIDHVTITTMSALPPRRTATDNFSILWSALAALQRRRVALTIILPPPMPAHPATLRNAWAAAEAATIGAHITLLQPGALLHAKTYRIDDAALWIGSGNLTTAAANHNHEAWLRTTEPLAIAGAKAWAARISRAAP